MIEIARMLSHCPLTLLLPLFLSQTNVRRQKSGLPMWPPQRPPSMYGRKKYGSRLDDLPEGST